VGIKINSRRLLNCICTGHGVPADKFAPVCVILDKLDKIGDEAVKAQLTAAPLDIPGASVDKMLDALKAESVDAVLAQLGEHASSEMRAACAEIARLFDLAAAYGFREFLQFDASVVRGLAYVVPSFSPSSSFIPLTL
jgi:histidyl-tRNA synthetase